MHSTICALIGWLSISSTFAFAQSYDTPKPVPATTAVPALHAQAVARAVHEHFAIGLDALARHDDERAILEFKAILFLNPVEPQGSTAYYDLSIAQANANRNDDAADSLRAAIKRDPGFLAAMANLIAVDIRRGDVREARDVADRLVALAPDSARGLYSRGLLALNAGDFVVARSDFEKLLQNQPQYAVAHYDLGITEERIGAYAAAEREFSQAIALVPNYARARFALGTILLRDGNRAEARVAFDRAATDANDDDSLRGLAITMRDTIPEAH